MGGMISAPAMAGLNGQKSHATFVQFSAAQESLVAEIADTIIPTTDTPGAKAAGVEKFILRVVQDCYPENSQKTFAEGLAKLDADCQARFGKGFIDASSTQRKEALTTCMLGHKKQKRPPNFLLYGERTDNDRIFYLGNRGNKGFRILAYSRQI
jgi:hypothetical protein